MDVRVQKLLAEAGLASRREAERWIRDGRVQINGRVAKLGDRADPESDRVELDGERILREPKAFWMLNKPRGVVTTRRDPERRRTVIDLLPGPARRMRLNPVGRLDLESEGLVLMTNDGALAHRLLHPRFGSEKEYRVTVRGRPEAKTLAKLAKGVWLEDGRTAPAEVALTSYDDKRDRSTLRVVLREGRKRQIRRALLRLGHPVHRLARVRIGTLRLGSLRPGSARALTREEIDQLQAHAR